MDYWAIPGGVLLLPGLCTAALAPRTGRHSSGAYSIQWVAAHLYIKQQLVVLLGMIGHMPFFFSSLSSSSFPLFLPSHRGDGGGCGATGDGCDLVGGDAAGHRATGGDLTSGSYIIIFWHYIL